MKQRLKTETASLVQNDQLQRQSYLHETWQSLPFIFQFDSRTWIADENRYCYWNGVKLEACVLQYSYGSGHKHRNSPASTVYYCAEQFVMILSWNAFGRSTSRQQRHVQAAPPGARVWR